MAVYLKYKDHRFGSDALSRIEEVNAILEEYAGLGYDLTLRQCYYQLVGKAVIENTERSYKNLGSLINDARMAGLMRWDMIVDRTRNLTQNPRWRDPTDAIAAIAQQYRIDKWADQNYYCETWVEKEALEGVLERVCGAEEIDVPYFSCRGYGSQSEMWAAGRRLMRHEQAGHEPVIIHLGDHDPSGIDMTRDIEDRLETFCGFRVKVDRIALNFDQVQANNLPPNPCKVTDSRATGYIDRFGVESWELDALRVTEIADMIRTAILKYRDEDEWDASMERQEEEREQLTTVSERWRSVQRFLSGESE